MYTGLNINWKFQFSSVAQSCLTLCNPMDYSLPGLPVHHQFLEFIQTHVHWVGDAIQPSYPLSSHSQQTLNTSHHQDLFQWVSSSHQVAKALELQHQQTLPMNIQDWFPLGLTGLILLQSKGHSRVFSNATIQKHKFFGLNFLYCPTLNIYYLRILPNCFRDWLYNPTNNVLCKW